MATTKPRITISLEPFAYQVLSTLSDLDGAPMSRFVSDLVHQAAPGLQRLTKTLEEARRVRSDLRLSSLMRVNEADEALAPLVQAARNQLDMFGGGIESEDASTLETENQGGELVPFPSLALLGRVLEQAGWSSESLGWYRDHPAFGAVGPLVIWDALAIEASRWRAATVAECKGRRVGRR